MSATGKSRRSSLFPAKSTKSTSRERSSYTSHDALKLPSSADNATSASIRERDPDLERKKMLRAIRLFEYIDQVQENENSKRRAMLLDHIGKQKDKIERTQEVLERRRVRREFEDESRKKKFLLE
ncbi:hypothetical protein HK104_005016, partial [Borealophlyctis nickersoniae]